MLPFTRRVHGEYVPLDRKSTLIHYFVWFLKFLMLLHKFAGLATILFYEPPKIETFLCSCHFLIYFISFCISLGVVYRPKETMDLLNSWPLVLSCLKEIRQDVLSHFDDLSTAVKIITALATTQGIALTAGLLTLGFRTLPTSYVRAADSLGLISDGIFPRFGWQLIFFPLELCG